MTENTRKYVIVGGIGLGAVALLAMLAKTKTGGGSATVIQAAGSSPDVSPTLNIPVYPAASFAASPITIIEAPTFNAPGQRPSFWPTEIPKKGDQCGCADPCAKYLDYPPLTLEVYASVANRVADFAKVRRSSGAPTVNNLAQQFNPVNFPFLFQGGK